MRYREYEGTAEELIRDRLREAERQEHMKILYAVESGSRAWGFASPDSDYDVRFVYVRPLEDYLCLQERRDVCEREMDETLDINGWDLSKVLRHLHRSNAVLYEWLNSPAVYLAVPEWERVRACAGDFFSCKAAMYHYYGSANQNYLNHLTGEQVSYKKYLYVLRPLLACRWIEREACPPPVPFEALSEAVLEEELRDAVDGLVREKMRGDESRLGSRIPEIDGYLEKKLVYYRQKAKELKDDRKQGWEALNRLFLEILRAQ